MDLDNKKHERQNQQLAAAKNLKFLAAVHFTPERFFSKIFDFVKNTRSKHFQGKQNLRFRKQCLLCLRRFSQYAPSHKATWMGLMRGSVLGKACFPWKCFDRVFFTKSKIHRVSNRRLGAPWKKILPSRSSTIPRFIFHPKDWPLS